VAVERSLPTLLSQVLIAFTIEFDNEAERRIPHHTTVGRRAGEPNRGPWLASLAMWANFMRFVDVRGTPLRELAQQARLTNLKGLLRWGYITLAPPASGSDAAPARGEELVRPTGWGRAAQEVWAPLGALVESRWQERLGDAAIARLRTALEAVAGGIELELPDYLPVAGVHRGDPDRWRPAPPGRGPESGLGLSVLLARVLLAFSIDFERESRVSLALGSNALRVLRPTGLRVRDLPLTTGVSKEAISVSLGFLQRRDCVVVEPDPAAARTKRARLTQRGVRAQQKYLRLLGETQAAWRTRFGASALDELGASLGALLDARDADGSPLGRGLVPAPGGWRTRKPYLAQTEAMISDPGAALPHYPMVSHRGAYPDGS
jgi:DNA-binding MarR family transcriptional regulator